MVATRPAQPAYTLQVTRRKDAGVRIGIDLGTTHSLASVLMAGQAIIIPNLLGERLTPSAVSVDGEGRTVVGAPAKARELTHPRETVCNFKRDMGTERTWSVAGKSMRPESLSALVLADLRQSVEEHLGQRVLEAVVTVPAYFGEDQRRATQAACEIAGLHVERIINEPTAAALAYGFGNPDSEAKLVVLDLGGGTFDVSVLEVTEGIIEILASAGDARLGGEDFVELMMEHCGRRILETEGIDLNATADLAAKLRVACERAKRALSSAEQASVVVAGVGPTAKTFTLEVTREQVHGWWAPLVSRMQAPIRQALKDAGWMCSAVDQVLLVGGATRMPLVDELVSSVFNKEGTRTLSPDEAVAMGAAVQAALKADDAQVEDLVVTDIAPFSLGVEHASEYGRHRVNGMFSAIVERGTVLPASRSHIFTTMDDNQRVVRFRVYQGEHALCENNTKIGEYEIKGVPPGPAGKEQIEVRFSYDLNGLLEVETTVLSTGKKHVLVLDRSGRGMSKAEVARAQTLLQSLKFHPREALPNVAALERAEALFTTLTRDDRALLGEVIGSFKSCLETQDPTLIREHREHLLAAVERLQQH